MYLILFYSFLLSRKSKLIVPCAHLFFFENMRSIRLESTTDIQRMTVLSWKSKKRSTSLDFNDETSGYSGIIN